MRTHQDFRRRNAKRRPALPIYPHRQTADLPLDTILHGDVLNVLRTLPSESINCVVTSPPYFGLRDYGIAGQIGNEPTPDAYVKKLAAVFREIWRVLRKDGVIWLNLGDSYHNYRPGKGQRLAKQSVSKTNQDLPALVARRANRIAGIQEKSLIGIPWRVAFALQADGWILRSDVIWHKPNPMPESVKDRCTVSHEYVFMLTKSPRYWFDMDAIREPHQEVSLRRIEYGLHHRHPAGVGVGIPPVNTERMGDRFAHALGRNKRSVWTIPTQAYKDAHFAVFPSALIEPMILAGCPKGGAVLDPFMGSGTTALVARYHGRRYVGIELNENYIRLAQTRLRLPFEPRPVEETRLEDLPLFSMADIR